MTNRENHRLTLDANTITTLDDHRDIAYGINTDGTTTIWLLDYTDPTPTHTRHKDPA